MRHMEPSFQQRIQSAIETLTIRKDELVAETKKLEGQITKLSLLVDGADDPEFEELIFRVASPVETTSVVPQSQSEPEPEPVPPPPPIKRVRVTCDGIYAITQTFDRLFTLNDVVDILADNEAVTDVEEKKRVRSAVSTMMQKLVSNGRLVHHEKGRGKIPGQYRKVHTTDFRRIPMRDGIPPDIEIDHVEEVEEPVTV